MPDRKNISADGKVPANAPEKASEKEPDSAPGGASAVSTAAAGQLDIAATGEHPGRSAAEDALLNTVDNTEGLEPVPAKSPHRKYLVLLALHMVHTDDPRLFSRITDCSERTFHYVKSRLCKHDGVIISYDRRAGRYTVVHSGVLDLNRVAELMRRHYPKRFEQIERLARESRARFVG
ncbi:MAG: hypothetical protein AAGI24_00170 [Pseudomonadota bacterium]